MINVPMTSLKYYTAKSIIVGCKTRIQTKKYFKKVAKIWFTSLAVKAEVLYLTQK